MGFFSSISKAVRSVGDSIGKAVKGVVKGVKGVIGKVKGAFGKVSSFLGPVGTIALIAAMPYIATWASTTWGAAAGANAAQISSVAAAGTTAGAATAGGSALTAGVGQAAALGGAGSSSLFTSAALGETVAAASTVSSTSLGLGATLAPYTYTAGAAEAFSAAEALAFVDTTGAASLGSGGTGLYASEALGETAGKGFDWKKAGKKAASLLAGGEVPMAGGYSLTPPAIPGLDTPAAAKGLTSASAGGLGVSKFIEEAQPGLIGGLRSHADSYRSILARGY